MAYKTNYQLMNLETGEIFGNSINSLEAARHALPTIRRHNPLERIRLVCVHEDGTFTFPTETNPMTIIHRIARLCFYMLMFACAASLVISTAASPSTAWVLANSTNPYDRFFTIFAILIWVAIAFTAFIRMHTVLTES